MRALDIASTGLTAQQANVDAISQNLANATTTGFKAERPEFTDLLYQDQARAGNNSTDQGTILPVGIQVGLGVKQVAISHDTGQGTVQGTQNPLDVAVQGKGYFQVQLPDGTTAYTRDGSFKISPEGVIVTNSGYTVEPAITIPNNAVSMSIDTSGEVSVTIQGQTDPTNLGQLQLATFVNPNGLNQLGDNLLQESAASGTPIVNNPGLDGTGTVLQGYLENSNVNSVTEVTNLIVAQRAYEMNTKVLTAVDKMLDTLNQSA